MSPRSQPAEFDVRCVHCGRLLELHSNVDGATPSPGDFSICWKCGGVAAYNEDLQLVGLTEDQMEELEQNLDYIQARAAWARSRLPSEMMQVWGQMRSNN